DPIRARSEDLSSRCELQGPRGGQPVRRRWQLLLFERRGQSRIDDHGECAPYRRSFDRQDAMRLLLVLFSAAALASDQQPLVTAVDSIGLTVSDLDRSIEFYAKVLSFEKVSEREVYGDEYEHLEGVFGARARIARMRLGDEFVELTEFLAPNGRPAPLDA